VCALERLYLDSGLIDVQEVDPAILVDLKYARPDNFMGEPVYGSLRRCYLQPEAAMLLGKASRILETHRPGLRLLVADGVRPRRVQRRMWELVKGTPMQSYVADPATGSMHNFGAAVDLTLASPDGSALDMGTGLDHFGILAQPREEERLLGKGALTAGQVENRRLLRQVMADAGFRPLAIEWWHFDAFGREETRRRFSIVE
jgi:zinc D-Ala-D-Ala dipeptidase